MTEWEPFGLGDDERAAYQVLVDGVPEWMAGSLYGWILATFPTKSGYPEASTCRDIRNECRVELKVSETAGLVSEEVIARQLEKMPPVHVLRVVDWMLARQWGWTNQNALSALLSAGRSRWMVGSRNGHPGLVERVPEGVQDAVEGTIDSTGRAGELLARAWSGVHGIEPDPSGAYALAVRAVEAAAIPIVQPEKKDATLGSVLGQMKVDGDWRLPLREHVDAPGSRNASRHDAHIVVRTPRPAWKCRLRRRDARRGARGRNASRDIG